MAQEANKMDVGISTSFWHYGRKTIFKLRHEGDEFVARAAEMEILCK